MMVWAGIQWIGAALILDSSYVETARRLDLDRRTVKARVDAGRAARPER